MFDTTFSHMVCWSTHWIFQCIYVSYWAVFSTVEISSVHSIGFFFFKPCFYICQFEAWGEKFPKKNQMNSCLKISTSKYKVLVQVFWGSVVYAMPLLTNCKVLSQWAYLSVEKKHLVSHWSCDSRHLAPQAKWKPFFHLLTVIKCFPRSLYLCVHTFLFFVSPQKRYNPLLGLNL